LQKNFIQKGQELQKEWEQDFVKYKEKYPDLAKELEWMEKRELPENWEEALPEFKDYSQKMATRKANGKILNAIAKKVSFLLGGSADLAGSNKTTLEGEKSFLRNQYDGRNFHFGVREHAMGAILNGMSLSKLRVYGGTFLVFSDYMRPAIRLSALMHQPVIYILTHDSIGLGEDGPTHQPIEQLEALRAIPNLDVIRPADGNELAQLWKHILASKDRAMALALSRQGLPTIDRKKYANPQSALKGGYILADSQSEPEFILIATGSEVHLCLEAYEKLTSEGVKVRVVSMPCTSLFERQSQEYKERVLPPTVRKRIAVEAGSSGFWYKYAGLEGLIIGIEHRFGASAPGNLVMEKYGFNVENIIEKSKKLL
jgi:transketolase